VLSEEIIGFKTSMFTIIGKVIPVRGVRGSVVIKALPFKLEGCGFETRRGEFLTLPNPSGSIRP
jgi:hypothetical protein